MPLGQVGRTGSPPLSPSPSSTAAKHQWQLLQQAKLSGASLGDRGRGHSGLEGRVLEGLRAALWSPVGQASLCHFCSPEHTDQCNDTPTQPKGWAELQSPTWTRVGKLKNHLHHHESAQPLRSSEEQLLQEVAKTQAREHKEDSLLHGDATITQYCLHGVPSGSVFALIQEASEEEVIKAGFSSTSCRPPNFQCCSIFDYLGGGALIVVL